jgi:hypothetical protein
MMVVTQIAYWYELAKSGKLPENFGQWDLADNNG